MRRSGRGLWFVVVLEVIDCGEQVGGIEKVQHIPYKEFPYRESNLDYSVHLSLFRSQ